MQAKTSLIKTYLAITAYAFDKVDFVNYLSKQILKIKCNIESCTYKKLGDMCSGSFLVSGNWGQVAKLETMMLAMEAKPGICISFQRTTLNKLTKKLAYTVNAITPDKNGVINAIHTFFATRDIEVDFISCDSFTSSNAIDMVAIQFRANLPIDSHIPQIRDEFMVLCDEINLDASFEPQVF